MTTRLTDIVPIEDPLAALERDLIASYVTRAGEDLHDLRTRTDGGARNLLAAASRYASTRLTEIGGPVSLCPQAAWRRVALRIGNQGVAADEYRSGNNSAAGGSKCAKPLRPCVPTQARTTGE